VDGDKQCGTGCICYGRAPVAFRVGVCAGEDGNIIRVGVQQLIKVTAGHIDDLVFFNYGLGAGVHAAMTGVDSDNIGRRLVDGGEKITCSSAGGHAVKNFGYCKGRDVKAQGNEQRVKNKKEFFHMEPKDNMWGITD